VSEELKKINPYRFRLPLAPSVAAELEGKVIKKSNIISAYRYLKDRYQITIVEGAGGLMVPIYKKYLFIDLIKDLNLPVVIVSRPSLGTINHTLLTIEAARSKGLEVLGIIINYSTKTKKGLPEKTNPEIIERIGGIPLWGIIPYSKKFTPQLKRRFVKIAELILSCI
jgi:dethiobiotin synthetase